jgi:hypothetical protein
MFALLEHDTSSAAGIDPAERGRHWDLLVEVRGCERLLTWRLAGNPLDDTGEIPAQRIGDHRRLYLEYEGEISGGRGRVRRIDDGAATINDLEGVRVRFALAGRHLRGAYEIIGATPGELVFRRVRDGPRPDAGLPI